MFDVMSSQLLKINVWCQKVSYTLGSASLTNPSLGSPLTKWLAGGISVHSGDVDTELRLTARSGCHPRWYRAQ